jgi:hypothetical protein
MGHGIAKIRELRSQNVGAECSTDRELNDELAKALKRMGDTTDLPARIQAMLRQYLLDMDRVFSEIARVLRKTGEAVVVIGDSTIKGVFIHNSWALTSLAKKNGLVLRSRRRRPLLVNRRYLPPPDSKISGKELRTRMREEVLLTFRKVG